MHHISITRLGVAGVVTLAAVGAFHVVDGCVGVRKMLRGFHRISGKNRDSMRRDGICDWATSELCALGWLRRVDLGRDMVL